MGAEKKHGFFGDKGFAPVGSSQAAYHIGLALVMGPLDKKPPEPGLFARRKENRKEGFRAAVLQGKAQAAARRVFLQPGKPPGAQVLALPCPFSPPYKEKRGKENKEQRRHSEVDFEGKGYEDTQYVFHKNSRMFKRF
jgi:hypothetical protein